MKNSSCAGFGLVELMVSISIMALVASIILARQDSFNGAVLLRSQAYRIALAIREVQLSAVSASSDGSGGFRTVYGLYFSDATAPANGFYQVFRDGDNDYFYDVNSEEFGQMNKLDKRFEIKDVRAVGGAMVGNELSIVFERPNFDAGFYDSSGEISAASGVEIDIARVGTNGTGCGDIRTIEVTRTGQIAVKDCP